MGFLILSRDIAAGERLESMLSYLRRLEAESIHMMREVAGEFRRPVMLGSLGKETSVLLHLARKAFHPSGPPFPLLHIDTTWRFPEMYAYRDHIVRDHGMELLVHVNRQGHDQGISPVSDETALFTHAMETEALRQALDNHGFDAVFDDTGSNGERALTVRSADHRRQRREPGPELWSLYNTRIAPGESAWISPLSRWTQHDLWRYIEGEGIAIVPLYLAAPRPVVERNGMLIMRVDKRMELRDGETVRTRRVRFPTLGCWPLTGAIESTADSVSAIIDEMVTLQTSHRGAELTDGEQRASLAGEEREAGHDLHIVMCGSADDGKSTLVERLLRDTALIVRDDLVAAGPGRGTHGDDDREAERPEDRPIDVARHRFQTSRRRFRVADSPGDVPHTRDMVSGASRADLALLVVDATRDVLTQSLRHAAMASLLGIPSIILAVNKMDLVDWDEAAFQAVEEIVHRHAGLLAFSSVHVVPVSAATGANVFERSSRMPWYRGPPLLGLLESSRARTSLAEGPFRMPVQRVGSANQSVPCCSGLIVSGTVRPGMAVITAPSLRTSTVARVLTVDGDLDEAGPGESVTLELIDDPGAKRGHVLAASSQPPQSTDQFAAHIIWMDEDDLLPERLYVMKSGSQTVNARITDLRHCLDVDTLQHRAARTLSANDIGSCNLALDQTIACDPYREVNDTGSFILIDRFTGRTVAAGMIDFGLRRARNLERQAIDVARSERAAQKHQKPCIVWFTGLSGSGKSTTANHVERRLAVMGRHSYLLDGDNIRFGLNRDLGFTDADRVENIRRIAEVARLFVDAGLIVLVSFISPFRAERQMARELVDEGEFVEVFIDTPLDVCEARDPKGLYRKARAGELRNFTGIDSAYEAPQDPDIVLKAAERQPDELAATVVAWLVERGHLDEAGGT